MEINQIQDSTNWLMDLGAAPFSFIACIVFSYVFRMIPIFPNRWIPFICILFGPIMFCLLNPHSSSINTTAFYAHSIVGGFFIGLVAWLAHDKWASKIEDVINTKFPSASIVFTTTQQDGSKTSSLSRQP